MVTIRDVARAAGVSHSTVSYVLSGKRSISDDTRDRILRVIDELGFTPHAGARALAMSQTRVLGLYLQFESDEFAPGMLQYVLPISAAAREAGYDVLMVTDADLVGAITRTTSAAMVDGMLLLDVTFDDPRLEAVRAAPQPAGLLGFVRDASEVDAVDLDFGEAARLAVDHLVALGHEALVLVTPPHEVEQRGGSYLWRFRDAAMERAARHGVRLSSVYGGVRREGITDALDRAREEHPEATALIVHNDATAAALPHYLWSRGVRVPDDLSIVGVYSQSFAETFSLDFSFVETFPDRLGTEVVQRLVSRIATPDSDHARIRLIEPLFVDRASTRAL